MSRRYEDRRLTIAAAKKDARIQPVELLPEMAVTQAVVSLCRPRELLLLASLLVCYWLIYALEAVELYHTTNLSGPIALTAILGWSCYSMVRRSPITVWTPLFWFRLACATYFGFGALVPHIVNQETQAYIFSVYIIDETINLKVNLVYTLGILCTLAFSYFFLQIHRGKHAYAVHSKQQQSSRTLFFALCFLLIGGGIRYGVVVPYMFGFADFILPGMVITLSKIYYVGIYLLIVYANSYDRKLYLAALTLAALEIAISVASFAKSELLLILVFSFLGFISYGASKKVVVLGAACVLFAYFAFQPLVGYGRDAIAEKYGEIRGASLGERWEIVQTYLDGGRESTASTLQMGLVRLTYVNVAALVIDQYDSGIPGNTFSDAAAVFIPRVLWPNKPIITQLGQELRYLVRGRYGGAMGAGHFAEAYWNVGWIGTVALMALLALILSIFSRVSLIIMARKDWLYLPIVFIGVNMGFRVDGHFVPDILGGGWTALVLGLGLVVIKVLTPTSARKLAHTRQPVVLPRKP